MQLSAQIDPSSEGIVEGLVVKLVENEDEFESAIAVRFRVFVAEQAIPPEEELDEDDATAIHAIALVQGQVVGTGRLVSREDGDGQVGRMAVDQPWRGQGVGGRILIFLEDEARFLGMARCVLHAQEYVKGFYAAHGYQEYGETFLEVDIPHVEMHKEL